MAEVSRYSRPATCRQRHGRWAGRAGVAESGCVWPCITALFFQCIAHALKPPACSQAQKDSPWEPRVTTACTAWTAPDHRLQAACTAAAAAGNLGPGRPWRWLQGRGTREAGEGEVRGRRPGAAAGRRAMQGPCRCWAAAAHVDVAHHQPHVQQRRQQEAYACPPTHPPPNPPAACTAATAGSLHPPTDAPE